MLKKIVFVFACWLAVSVVSAQKGTVVDLFNGTNLDNWKFVLKDTTEAPGEVFQVQNGTILIKGTPFGYMYTSEKYDNFTLSLEWRWPEEAANSGIFLFVQDDLKVWPNAIECQLKAGSAGDFVLLGGSGLAEFVQKAGEERPKFPMIKKQQPSSELPVGEWNKAKIVCRNGTISVVINGVKQNQGTQSQHRIGHIALQSEGGAIQFRNVKLIPAKK